MSNPLREAPFFQVANVNPDDPISVQIEQIEQLNTLLLQDIDHNFARFHDVVNNKILPQVKKYALVSQSTQEASRFWETFFNAAAFGRTAVEGQDPDRTADDNTQQLPHSTYYSEHEETLDQTAMMNMTPDEHSFLYGNPIASTPLARHHLHHLEGGQAGGDWAEGMSSMESPYASLDRKMKAVLENDEGMSSTHTGGFAGDKSDSTLGGPGATPRQGGSGHPGVNEPYQTPEGLDEEPSVLISRTDMGKITGRNGRQDASLASTDLPDLPSANKPKARVPFKSPRAAQNPFSPGGFGAGGKTRTAAGSGSASGSGSGQAWNGIADLRNTPLNPKIKPLSFAKRTPTQARPGQPANIDADGSFDASSDEDEVPSAGMMGTPPMTMNFSLPTRTIISKTPAKEAAKAVMKNLMMDDGMMDSPAMPTPPAFSKYAAQHRSDVMRSGGGGGGTARRLFTHEMDRTGDLDEGDATVRLDRMGSQMESLGMNDSIPMEDEAGPSVRESDVSTVGMPKHRRSTVPQLDFLDESFDDSLDEMPLPALPQGYVTESYGTADEEVEHDAGEPQHGDDSLALGGDEGGDFTITGSGQQGGREEVTGYGEDEGMTGGTVRSEAGEIFGGQGRAMSNKGQFALFGPDEMQTFHGGRLLDAAASPQDSPSYALGAKKANKRP